MSEPTITTAAGATIAAAMTTVPPLVLLGVNLGLRADVLIAGFAGALVAIVLLNSVPSEGDNWQHLMRTTVKRMFVSLASSLTAGYFAPLFVFIVSRIIFPASEPNPALLEALLLPTAFGLGAGAQKALRWTLDKFKSGKPAEGGS